MGKKLLASLLVFTVSLSVLVFKLLSSPLNQLADLLSTTGKLTYSVPDLFLKLNDAVGVLLFLFAVFLAVWHFREEKLESFTRRNYAKAIKLLVAVALLLLLLNSLSREFDHDEIEHIHASWYISQGELPYKDFFEHHHPLSWYIFSIVLSVLGYSTASLLVLRLLVFASTLAILAIAYLISKQVTKSEDSSLLSLLTLSTLLIFLKVSMQVRPDGLQALFALLSIFFFLSFHQNSSLRHLAYSSASAALAFLILQKSAFLTAFLFLILLYLYAKKKASARALLTFPAVFLTVIAPYYLYLAYTGSLSDYIITNVLLNINIEGHFSPILAILYSLVENPVFWLLASPSLAYIFLSRKENVETKLLALLAAYSLFTLFLFRVPTKSYFIIPTALLAITVGRFLAAAFDERKIGYVARVLVLLALTVPALLVFSVYSPSNSLQLDSLNYVYNSTTPSDFVYNSFASFNVFRQDLHYFWFSPSTVLPTYNSLTNNSYADYDLCALIREKKPVFVTQDQNNEDANLLAACGVESYCKPTAYPHLYRCNFG